MNATTFDRFVRSLTSSRRALGSLAAGALSLAHFDHGLGKNKKKKRKKKRGSCKGKKNGKCKHSNPSGTPCGSGNTGQNGPGVPPLGASPTCSPSNDFCSQQWANGCFGYPNCGCFATVEGQSICGNTTGFAGCPETTGCTSSNDCGSETSFCVSLSCCPTGKAVCVPLCVT